MELRSHDMYGQEIVPLGETGFGVSTPEMGFYPDGDAVINFWVFHISDGFRQALFGVMLGTKEDRHPHVINIFHDRVEAVKAYMREQHTFHAT